MFFLCLWVAAAIVSRFRRFLRKTFSHNVVVWRIACVLFVVEKIIVLVCGLLMNFCGEVLMLKFLICTVLRSLLRSFFFSFSCSVRVFLILV